MEKLSQEAVRAIYEYNKQQQGYWVDRVANDKSDFQSFEEETISVSRNVSDELYIAALEDSNKVLNSENRRLIRLLHTYQTIITQLKVAAQ